MAPANASHRPLSIALLVLSVLHTIIIVAAGALAISVVVSAPFGSSPAISAAVSSRSTQQEQFFPSENMGKQNKG
ncbi:hypothetical protein IE81DRAFT_348432 [Ceraceosorus guamensis]|uniref:Uncharacterized protein n=1 Tax=Ceraceosorus guamensis TaxID=1522189 RepID=A0A316VUT4_9BASI|nr:hypothetical protein IE81DRAFT_348432 [Ceraceosorus guamensis]PWN41386.1 hypothetical protein IE81DRAFT_348432 [Ceraceosorus guamensis]